MKGFAISQKPKHGTMKRTKKGSKSVRRHVRELKYNANADAWKHLKNVLTEGRKDFGRLQFLLAGFFRMHPASTLDETCIRLFVGHLQAKTDGFKEKVDRFILALRGVDVNNIQVLVDALRKFEASKMSKRKTDRIGRIRFGEVDIARILADEIEAEYNLKEMKKAA